MQNVGFEMDGAFSRRNFLKGAAAGLAVGSAAVIAGCAPRTLSSGEDEPLANTASSNDLSSLGEMKPIDSFDFVDTIDTEVLVVGAGNAGASAFLAAVESGVDTLLIEQGTDETRNMAKNNLMGFRTRACERDGVNVDQGAVIKELARYASGRCDQELMKVWADNSAEAINRIEEVLEKRNCKFVIEKEETEGLFIKEYLTSHMAVSNDESMNKIDHTGFTIEDAVELGGTYRTETKLVQLIKEEDRIAGVVAETPDGYVRINASNGVILCTGGYSTNIEMMKIKNPLALSTTARIDPVNTNGAGILSALWVGAAMDEVPTVMVFDRGALLPDELPGTEPFDRSWWWPGSQPFLRVNHNGERFASESNPYDFVVHAASLQPKKCWIQVWDSSFWDNVAKFQTVGCSRLIQKEGAKAPVIWPRSVIEEDWANLEKAGYIIKAETLEEIAEAFDLPVDTFLATVERYNELAEKGVDEDFYCESFRMSTLKNPPYYAINLASRLLCTLDGLRINEKMEVLDTESRPIPGLYAAGNDSGGFFANNYPELVVAVAAGRTVTFGRLAGKNAASNHS